MNSEKLIGQLIDRTMKKYGIVGKQLAEIANISETHLSQFRNSKTHLADDRLVSLLEGMEELAPGSRVYFCQQLSNQPLNIVDEEGLEELIDSMDLVQLSLLMDIATAKLRARVSQSKTKTRVPISQPKRSTLPVCRA